MSMTHQLGDLTFAIRGRVAANAVPVRGGPRFFGIAEISARGTSAPRYVDQDGDVESAELLAEGDVVMALLGKIGDAAVVDTDAAGAVLGRECVALRVKASDVLRPAWLCAWMGTDEFTFQVAQHTTGTTMPRLPMRALESFTVTVPPFDRQLEIEELVRRFDAAIAASATTLQELQGLRAAELQLAMANL